MIPYNRAEHLGPSQNLASESESASDSAGAMQFSEMRPMLRQSGEYLKHWATLQVGSRTVAGPPWTGPHRGPIESPFAEREGRLMSNAFLCGIGLPRPAR